MEILKGRPAAICAVCCVLISVFSVITESLLPYCVIAAAAIAAMAAASFLFLKHRLKPYGFFVSAIVLSVSVLFCVRCGFAGFRRTVQAEELCGENRLIRGTVTSTVSTGAYWSFYNVNISSVGAKKCSVGATLYCSYVCDLRDGYSFEITDAVIVKNREPSCLSDGLFLEIESDDYRACSVLSLPEKGLKSTMRRVRDNLSGRLEAAVGGEEGKLASGILLGTKNVSDAVRRDFRRAGISHLLSVSGMHLAVISAFIEGILKKIGTGKMSRTVICAFFMIAYLFMLGFPVSAVRSVCMLLITYLGFFLGTGSDGISSLSFSVMIILAVNPLSVSDAGFILTVCATLGMLSVMNVFSRWLQQRTGDKYGLLTVIRGKGFAERRKRRNMLIRSVNERITTAIAASLSVNILTVLPVSLLFGEISLMTFPSNLLFPPLATVIMATSLLTVAFSPVELLSGMFGYYTSVLCRIFIDLASWISSIRNVSLSLRYGFVPFVLVPAAVITALLLIIRLKRKYLICVPFICSALLLAVLIVPATRKTDTVDLYLTESSAGEAIAAGGGNTALIIDVSSGSSTVLSDAYEQVQRTGATEVEAVVLTHYHARHISALSSFMSKNLVRNLWVPEPVTSQDAGFLEKIRDVCRELNVRVYVYGDFSGLKVFGDVELCLSGAQSIKRSTHPVTVIEMRSDNDSFLFVGKSAWENDVCAEYLSGKTFAKVVYGLHGPVEKNSSGLGIFGTSETVYRDGALITLTLPREPSSLEKMKNGRVSTNDGVIRFPFRR